MEIIIIAAMSENRVIGKNNALPWSLKADLVRFKELTLGWPCVMGRKTWESLPKRPLVGRPNIVVSRSLAADDAQRVPGVTVVPSLQVAIQQCAQYEKMFVCGGASIYHEAIPLAHVIELTVLHRQYEGDTFFPEINTAQWEKTAEIAFDDYSFIHYNRILQ